MFHTNSITMLFLFVWDYWKPTYIIHWFIFQCIEWHFAECLCFSARSIQGKNSINRVLMILTCLSNTKIFCRHHSPSCLGSLASLLLMAGEVWCLPSIGAISPASLSECRRLVSVQGWVTWEREQGRWLAGDGTWWSRSCGLEGRQKPISWLMWGEGGGGEVRPYFDLFLFFPSPMNKWKLMPWKKP